MTFTSQVNLDERLLQEAPTVSVVIPFYGSRNHFATLINLLQELFPLLGLGSELLLVNDGDPNLNDVSVYNEFLAINRPVTVLNLKKNIGQMSASLCGMSMAKCPIVLSIDADTCCDAQLLLDLAHKAQTSGHVAYLDIRTSDYKRPMFRRALSWINKKIFRLLIKNEVIHQYSGSSVRAIERSLVEKLLQEESCAEMMDVWLLNSADKVFFIPYSKTGEYRTSYSSWSLALFVYRFFKCFFKKKNGFKATDYIYQTKKLTG